MGPYAQRRMDRRLDAAFDKAGVNSNLARQAYENSPLRGRFDGLAQRDAIDAARYTQQAKAAEGARFGSLAATNDPNRYGSLASTKSPTMFGPDAMQRRSEQPAADLTKTAEPPKPGPALFDPNLVGSAAATPPAPAADPFRMKRRQTELAPMFGDDEDGN